MKGTWVVHNVLSGVDGGGRWQGIRLTAAGLHGRPSIHVHTARVSACLEPQEKGAVRSNAAGQGVGESNLWQYCAWEDDRHLGPQARKGPRNKPIHLSAQRVNAVIQTTENIATGSLDEPHCPEAALLHMPGPRSINTDTANSSAALIAHVALLMPIFTRRKYSELRHASCQSEQCPCRFSEMIRTVPSPTHFVRCKSVRSGSPIPLSIPRFSVEAFPRPCLPAASGIRLPRSTELPAAAAPSRAAAAQRHTTPASRRPSSVSPNHGNISTQPA
jgi:hypothetical protein